MTFKVKWGILGNATIARKCVIPAIFNSTNGHIHALGSRNPQGAKPIVKTYNIPQVYPRYESVLEDQQVNAVYIPLPNHLHKQWAIRALKAGKHVLCEKPLACNAAEAKAMVAVASEKGLLLMEALMYRFHPRSKTIHQMVNRGDIGRPRLVRASFCFHMAGDVFSKKENARLKMSGGGALLDVGCYGVSVARWMLGEEPEKVQAMAHYTTDGVDVHSAGMLSFQSGGLAIIEASFVSSLQQTYTIVGEEGSIELPHDAFIPWEKDATYTFRGKDDEIGRREIIPGADEYQLMVEHFADSIINGKPLLIQGDESIKNMRVLDALGESAKSGRMVTLAVKRIQSQSL
jgi:D-xylose 1-dehydrogenase (NADP+, D-xylono-1,5-lactone-forming)